MVRIDMQKRTSLTNGCRQGILSRDHTSNFIRFTNEGERIVLGYDLFEDQIERKLEQTRQDAERNLKYHSYLLSLKWLDLKRRVRVSCKNICEKCEKTKVAAIHHVTYRRLGNERLPDLLGVCNKCHKEIHKC